MDWGSPTNELDEIGKYLDNERSIRALSGIVGSILAESGEIPLDPNAADFGQQAAMRQSRMGEALLKGLMGHPDAGYIQPAQSGSLVNTAFGLQTKPLEFQAKEWEKNQNRQELERQKIEGRKDIQAQAAADRLKLQAERATKVREWKQLLQEGQITPEEYKAGLLTLYGLQGKPLSEKDKSPQWKEAGYGQMMDLNPNSPTYQKTMRVPTAPNAGGQPPSDVKIFERYKTDPAFATWYDKFGKKPNDGTTPIKLTDKARARREISSIISNPANYILNSEQKTKFDSGITVPLQDTQIRPEALDEINAIAQEAGLPIYSQGKVKYNTSRFGFNTGQEEGWGQVRPETSAPAARVVKPAGPGAGYQTPEAVRDAYRSGKLSKEQAASILRQSFGMK